MHGQHERSAPACREDEAIEEIQRIFRFVAGGEETEGVAVFTKDPREAELKASVATI